MVKSELPQIHLQICLYHVMRTFSREVSVEKLGITSGEKQTILELLQKIAYAKSTDDYEMQYNHLVSVMPPRVASYYNKQWHNIKEEWVEGLKKKSMNLGERTNNRIESFFGKLKSCVNYRNTLQELLQHSWGFYPHLEKKEGIDQ